MRVELGAGDRTAPGWLAVDVNPRNASVVADALRLPFASGSVTALRAIDVLEHLSYRVTHEALAEWARVLMRGASLFVQVPDAHEIMRRYVMREHDKLRTPDDLPDTLMAGATWRLLGGHADGHYVDSDGDWRWNAHYAMFSGATLRMALLDAGFDAIEIETNPHPNLLCKAARR